MPNLQGREYYKAGDKIMDWTVLQHVVIALAFAGIGCMLRNPVAGAAFGSALFIGREHAQAEYRWIEHMGGHLMANMPWWGGFDPSAWDWPSLFDWLMPAIVCAVFVTGFWLWNKFNAV